MYTQNLQATDHAHGARNRAVIHPLLEAVRRGYTDQIIFLLTKAKCDPCVECQNKETPLHRASQLGYTKICELLIQNNAVVLSLLLFFFFLHFCSHLCPVTSYEKHFLRENTQMDKVDALDAWNRTPLHHAASKGQTDIVASQTSQQKHRSYVKVCEMLIHAKASVNSQAVGMVRLQFIIT